MGEGKRPRKRRLATMSDLRRFMSDVTNEVHRDTIDPTKGSRLAYMVNVLLKIVQGTDLEKRVERLEAALSESEKEK